MKTVVLQCVLAVLLAAVLVWGAAFAWRAWFLLPYCVETDCRGKEIDIETIKQWEEREAQGPLRILRLAGWRIDRQQQVSSVSTGRKQFAQVIGVYGAMELVDPADILCGRYGLDVEADYCVISEELARELFGGPQVSGEWVRLGERRLAVAGVIRREGKLLLMPVKEGIIQQLAVELEGRSQARKRVERLVGE